MDERPKFMVRDRDRIYGEACSRQASALALPDVRRSSSWDSFGALRSGQFGSRDPIATIEKRGPAQWRVTIRRRGFPAESRTFETKTAAECYARGILTDLDPSMLHARFLPSQARQPRGRESSRQQPLDPSKRLSPGACS